MGCLEDLADKRRITLGFEFLIGRAHVCALVLNDPAVSGQHAQLRWGGGHWSVRDLGSKNGTWLDGRRLKTGRRARVRLGAILSFGGEHQRWRLIDQGAPVLAARHQQRGQVLRSDNGFLVLPGADHPEATLLRAETGCWRLEHADSAATVTDQQQLKLSDGVWQLFVPYESKRIESTRESRTPRVLQLMTLHLRVSSDEEHVEAELLDGERRSPLGARSHHHMLLALARTRLEDRDNHSIGPGAKGWIYTDELCSNLGCDPDQLNIYVFRARKQVAAAKVDNGGEIVERRPNTRQLRLGTERVVIEPLA